MLEGSNIKLKSAISDVLGIAGRAMLAALIDGETDPSVVAGVATTNLKAIGTDMSRFPSAAALASWAKVCPGNNQSGGKRRSGSTGKVKTPLRTTLVEAAHGASRKRNTYLGTMLWRLAARKGKQRAAMAGAHRILIIAYHILKDGTTYQDLGPDHQTQRNREAVIRRALTQLTAVGCTAKIEDAA